MNITNNIEVVFYLNLGSQFCKCKYQPELRADVVEAILISHNMIQVWFFPAEKRHLLFCFSRAIFSPS